MMNRTWILVVLAASVLSMGQTQPSIRPSELETRNRRQMRSTVEQDQAAVYIQQSVCLLQLVPDYPNSTIIFDQQSLLALINSPGVIDAAAASIKLSPEQRREYVNVVITLNQRGNMVFVPLEVSIRPGCPNVKGDTSTILLKEITTRLSEYFRQANANQKNNVDAKRKQLADELEDAQKKISVVREKTKSANEIAGYGTGNDIRTQLNNWRTELRRVESEANYARARLKSYEQAASAATQNQSEKASPATQPSDIVENPATNLVEALDRVVMIKRLKARYFEAQKDRGTTSAREYLDAIAELAAAETERLRYGGMSGSFGKVTSSEVTNLKMTIAMNDAQIKTLNEKIASVDEAKIADVIAQLSQLQQEENRLRMVIDSTNTQLNNMRNIRVDSSFSLYVLGIDDVGAKK